MKINSYVHSFFFNFNKKTKKQKMLFLFVMSSIIIVPTSVVIMYVEKLIGSKEIIGEAMLGFFMIFWVMILMRITKSSRTPRKGWTEDEKAQVRERQNGQCNKCGHHPPRWEYHHRNGDRSDNRLSNCEGLCPNCHSVETHG